MNTVTLELSKRTVKETAMNILGILLMAAGIATFFVPNSNFGFRVSIVLVSLGALAILTAGFILRDRLKKDYEAAIKRIETAYGVVYESSDRTLPLKKDSKGVFVVADRKGNHLPCTSEIISEKDHVVSLKVIASGGYMLPTVQS